MGHVSPPYVGHILGRQIVRMLTARALEYRRAGVADKLSVHIFDPCPVARQAHRPFTKLEGANYPKPVTCERQRLVAEHLVDCCALRGGEFEVEGVRHLTRHYESRRRRAAGYGGGFNWSTQQIR
jgi:hypothetical protein